MPPGQCFEPQLLHPHHEIAVHHSGLGQALESDPGAHGEERHRELPRVERQLDSALRREALHAPRERIDRPGVDLGEARAVLGVAQHVSPELEEDREPAVILLAAGGDAGYHAQHPLGGIAMPRDGSLRRLQIAIDAPLVHREEEVLFRREVRIDGSLRVARLVRHRVERCRVESVFAEEALGRVHELRARVRLALGAGQSGSHTSSI